MENTKEKIYFYGTVPAELKKIYKGSEFLENNLPDLKNQTLFSLREWLMWQLRQMNDCDRAIFDFESDSYKFGYFLLGVYLWKESQNSVPFLNYTGLDEDFLIHKLNTLPVYDQTKIIKIINKAPAMYIPILDEKSLGMAELDYFELLNLIENKWNKTKTRFKFIIEMSSNTKNMYLAGYLFAASCYRPFLNVELITDELNPSIVVLSTIIKTELRGSEKSYITESEIKKFFSEQGIPPEVPPEPKEVKKEKRSRKFNPENEENI